MKTENSTNPSYMHSAVKINPSNLVRFNWSVPRSKIYRIETTDSRTVYYVASNPYMPTGVYVYTQVYVWKQYDEGPVIEDFYSWELCGPYKNVSEAYADIA